jgi:hypothetical protein
MLLSFFAVLLNNVQDAKILDELLCFGVDLHPTIIPLNEANAFHSVQITILLY